jgi:hypothetical protein
LRIPRGLSTPKGGKYKQSTSDVIDPLRQWPRQVQDFLLSHRLACLFLPLLAHPLATCKAQQIEEIMTYRMTAVDHFWPRLLHEYHWPIQTQSEGKRRPIQFHFVSLTFCCRRQLLYSTAADSAPLSSGPIDVQFSG